MGVRLYNPILGRFLQTDPVPGGSANAYDYAAQDPINLVDLDGRMVAPEPGGSSGSCDCGKNTKWKKTARWYTDPGKWKRTYGGLSAGGFTLKGPFSINWVEVRYRSQITNWVRCHNHRWEEKTDIRDQRQFRVNVTVGYGFLEYEHVFYSHGWETLPE